MEHEMDTGAIEAIRTPVLKWGYMAFHLTSCEISRHLITPTHPKPMFL